MAAALQTSKLPFPPLGKVVDHLRCPAQGRSCAWAVFVSHVQLTGFALRVVWNWLIICGVQVNELTHSGPSDPKLQEAVFLFYK